MNQNPDTSSDILQQEIREQSQKEAESILEQAEKDARSILDKAGREAESIYSEIIKKAKEQAEGIRKRILSGVHLEIKNQQLRNRETIISELFQKLKDKFDLVRESKAYGDILEKFITEGVYALQETDFRIVPGKLEQKWLTPEFLHQIEKDGSSALGRPVKLHLSPETISEAGVIIESGDGRVRFDNRFSARMQRMQGTMRQFINKHLRE
jgi:V/A-type H+-transporting ATPase subunit E